MAPIIFSLILILFFRAPFQNVSASSPAKKDDAKNGKSPREEIKEDIKEIEDLVRKKRFRKNRKMVLKLLDDLSAKVEGCGGKEKSVV